MVLFCREMGWTFDQYRAANNADLVEARQFLYGLAAGQKVKK